MDSNKQPQVKPQIKTAILCPVSKGYGLLKALGLVLGRDVMKHSLKAADYTTLTPEYLNQHSNGP